MQLRLRQVELFMNALGQNVRYKPVDQLPAFESIDRLDMLTNKLAELSNALGLEQVAWPRWRFDKHHPEIRKEHVLLHLTETLYLLLGFYHALGMSNYAASAFTEVHASNMTRIWDDMKIHRDISGLMVKPPSYVAPDMSKVFSQHREPSLFEPQKPQEVIQDTEDSVQ